MGRHLDRDRSPGGLRARASFSMTGSCTEEKHNLICVNEDLSSRSSRVGTKLWVKSYEVGRAVCLGPCGIPGNRRTCWVWARQGVRAHGQGCVILTARACISSYPLSHHPQPTSAQTVPFDLITALELCFIPKLQKRKYSQRQKQGIPSLGP